MRTGVVKFGEEEDQIKFRLNTGEKISLKECLDI